MPLLIFLVFFVLSSIGNVCNATTIPPLSSVSIEGSLGQNDWYRSNLGITVSSTDNQSGVKQIVYWVDSDSPTVVDFSGSTNNQFTNYSFESGRLGDINNWYGGRSGLVVYYQSFVSSYEGNKSAAIAFGNIDPNLYFYWHNEPNAIILPEGQNIEISAWVRTIMLAGDTAYMEIWGQDASGNNDQLIATSNKIVGFHWNWQKVSTTFTVPTNTNYIYVKLGSNATPAAIVYYDYVRVNVIGSLTQSTNFTYSTEGVHVLHYYAKDFNENVETAKTTSLKIDKIVPNPWQNFLSARATCAHCYNTQVEVKDVTSGIDVSTAQYRFYTEHLSQYWSDWLPVDSVRLVDNSHLASDGETAFVKLITPEIDFGDSASPPFRVQYRISDMAGNLSTSPAYDITTPWVVINNGSMYIDGDIVLPTSPIAIPNINADAAAYDTIVALTSSTGWVAENYDQVQHHAYQIEGFLPEYNKIKSNAQVLSGQLPSQNGIYIVHSDYYLNSATVKSTYTNSPINAVFIIEGSLFINQSFAVSNTNCSIFLVEGNVLVDKQVEYMAGFYLAEGTFDSDTSGDSRKALVINGSMLALQGYILPRDLQDTGAQNNSNTPAETFNWSARYLASPVLSQYLNSAEMKYVWNEIEQP